MVSMAGQKPFKTIRCHECGGHGHKADHYPDGSFDVVSCRTCDGGGTLIVWPSGVIAIYPGGPLRGHIPNLYAQAKDIYDAT